MNTDRVVVITGAGGVGALLVKRFLNNGDTVLASDADEGVLKHLRGNLSYPGALITEGADISFQEDCRRLAEAARKAGGTSTCSSTAPASSPSRRLRTSPRTTGARSSTST